MRTSTNRFRFVVIVGLIGITLSTVCAMFGQDSFVNISELHKKDRVLCLAGEEPFTGTAAEYYDNGQLALTKEFVNGVLNGKTAEWYADGQVKMEVRLKNGVLIGDYNTWYSNGQKHLTLTYVNGTLNGVNTLWYDNGVKKAEGHFSCGTRNGLFEKWNTYGEIVGSTVYVNGTITENVG